MENEPVYCPYCGREMRLTALGSSSYFYACINGEIIDEMRAGEACAASAPFGKTPEEAYKKAKSLFKPIMRPMTWAEVEAHIGRDGPMGPNEFRKYANARPLYLEINPRYASTRQLGRFDSRVFCPWLRSDEILKMLWRVMREPEIYGHAIRFWPDEPTEEEKAAAKWEGENDATD